MLAVKVELLASHLEVVLRLVSASAEMIGPNHLLATLALRVLVREWGLNKIVAGVAVSIAVPLESAIERLISLLLLLQWRLSLELLEGRLGSLAGRIVGFSGPISSSLLLGVVAALERLRVLTEVRRALLRVDTLVPGSIRVTYKLALSVQVFPLLGQLFPWGDDHVRSGILHWLVRAHGVSSMIHTLMVWMHWHLHHVLLVGIWGTMLSHEWRVPLDCNWLGTMMWVHAIVRMTGKSVAWMTLVVSEVTLFMHFHRMTRVVRHLAWVRVTHLHVRMLWLHGVGMHDLLVALTRVLGLDIWLLDTTFFSMVLAFTAQHLFSVLS